MLQKPRLLELSLFTGYGGFTLGLWLAGLKVRTVGYVEINLYCQEIIKARIRDGLLDDAPIFADICAFRGDEYQGMKDWTVLAACFGQWWAEWPGVSRTITGVADRVARLSALGNGVVPAVVAEFLRLYAKADA